MLSICIPGFLCFCLPYEEARKSSERESDSNIGEGGGGVSGKEGKKSLFTFAAKAFKCLPRFSFYSCALGKKTTATQA